MPLRVVRYHPLVRIAHVTCLYVPEHRGGAPQQCHQIAVEQHRIGHQVAVFSGLLEPSRTMLEVTTAIQDGFPVTRIVTTDAFPDEEARNWRNPSVEPAFRTFLRDHRPDVVHFHAVQSLGASLVTVARRSGARVVVTMHDLWWVCQRQFCVDLTYQPCIPAVAPGSCACLLGTDALFDRRSYLDRVLADVDLTLVPSRSLLERLRMSGVGGRIEVDPNAVGLAPLSQSRHRGATRGQGPLRLLYIGGDAKQKGIHILGDALRRLEGAGVRIEADLYGMDPLSLDVTAWLRGTRARPERPFDPQVLDQVLAAHDVLVVPSVMYESSSRAVREALVRGLPVVATEVGGPEEVIEDGVNGLLVPPSDAAALADAIRRLDQDRTLLARLSGAGPRGEVPTKEEQADHLETLYATVGGAPPSGRRPSSPGRVLFVAGIDGSPLHYRVHQKVEQLRVRGVASVLRRYTEPDLKRDLDHADAVIVYRSPVTRELMRFIREVHRRHIPIRFDVDDLIFDPELAERLPTIAHLPRDERALWVEGVRRYRATLLECGAGIASTAEIARQMQRLGIEASVHRNGVDTVLAVMSEGARRARGSRLRRAREPFVLGYSSGTTTHDADLAMLTPILVDFLRAHPEARLILGGPLHPPPSLDQVAGQVQRLGFIAWDRHPTRLATFDLNLAPLIEGVFNESKSSIKWSEAALVDVPTLASATAPFRESIDDGVTGLVARDPEDWRELLEQAITQPERFARMGRRARLSAYRQGSPWTLGDNLLDILGNPVLDHRPEPRDGVDLWPSEVKRSSLEPAGLLPGLHVSTNDPQMAPGASLGGHRVALDLPAGAGLLARVDVYLATFSKQAPAPVSLEVRSSEGVALGRVELAREAIGDNGWAAFEFGALDGEPAVAELSSSPGAEISPYTRPQGSHYVDGRRKVGGIVARTFHRPPVPPDFGAPVTGREEKSTRWVVTRGLLAIAVRRAAFILRTEGPVDGFRRIARGVRRRAGSLRRRP